MDLGPESSFTKFPAQLYLKDWPFFLMRNGDGYKLLSAICPHQGGEVVDWGTTFLCPDHGWRFEQRDGVCINGPNSKMWSYEVTVQDGHLHADVPIR
jgi:nitrite reductase/ring-hydroxylating ferredoxin subunit